MDGVYLVQPPYSLAEFTKQPPDKSFSDIIHIPIALSRQHHPISIRLIRHQLKQLSSFQALEDKAVVCWGRE
jgi:hypothetical protein